MSEEHGAHEVISLYEIGTQMRDVLISPELDGVKLSELDLAFHEKAEGCIIALKNLRATIEAVEREVKTLQARKSSLKRNQEWLKSYLKGEMERAGVPKIKGAIHKASIGKAPLSVDVPNVNVIVDARWVKTSTEPRKREIIEHIKETGEVPEGVIPVHNTSLRIY